MEKVKTFEGVLTQGYESLFLALDEDVNRFLEENHAKIVLLKDDFREKPFGSNYSPPMILRTVYIRPLETNSQRDMVTSLIQSTSEGLNFALEELDQRTNTLLTLSQRMGSELKDIENRFYPGGHYESWIEVVARRLIIREHGEPFNF